MAFACLYPELVRCLVALDSSPMSRSPDMDLNTTTVELITKACEIATLVNNRMKSQSEGARKLIREEAKGDVTLQ